MNNNKKKLCVYFVEQYGSNSLRTVLMVWWYIYTPQKEA